MSGGLLGPYRLERELGAGGMGRVYAARVEGRVPGLDVGAVVALKIVHPHLLETPGFFKRFLREAQIGRAVVHENVVRTFDADAVSVGGAQHHFLVMEYVEGQTLRALLDEMERVPEELCRHLGREIAKGLAAVHAAGVVHRDLKPENVLVTREHAVKVMDLGVARLADESLRLSQSGAFVGSVEYAAPEQFGGKDVGPAADLHALGVMLYELATAQHPYRADDFRGVMRRVLDETPRRAGDVHPQLSPFFEEVVHALLEKKPAERFADAATLVGVLEEGERSAWWRDRAKAIRATTKRPLRRIRIPRETAVYGRDAELAKSRALFDRAKAGDGQVVLIEGEAGIGKSRLVDELVGRLQRDGEDLNFLFGSYPPGGAATAAGAFSTAFREHFGEAGAGAFLPQTPALVPAFDALLRGEPPPTGCEPLTKDSLQTCFVHVARNLAAERATIVLVDDLHFSNDDARALFLSMALAVPGHRLLLVGTTRPGLDEKWLADLTRLPQTTSLAVGRLGPKDLALLLKDSFKSEHLAQSLALQIGMKSDGNPFFAFEIIRGLREGQFITQRDDGTWASTRAIDDIKIPSSVLDLVNARVADLTQPERDLLDMAACWGFEFDPALVAEAVGAPLLPTLKTFGQIERRHRLVRAAGRRYAFDHHQVQEALYGSLFEQVREMYHGALASALEARTKAADADVAALDGALCVDLAEHFLKGAQGTKALRYLDAALTHLEKGYLNDAAIRLAGRALSVQGLVAGDARCDLLLRVATFLGSIGRREAEREACDEAITLADAGRDAARRVAARHELARHLEQTARSAEAVAVLADALAIARAAGDEKAEASVSGSLGVSLWSLGRFAEAQAHLERQLDFARRTGDRPSEGKAAGNLANVLASLGRSAESYALSELHLAIARERGDRRGESNALTNMAIDHIVAGRYGEGRRLTEQSLELKRQIGDRLGVANALGNLGFILARLGRLVEAREHFERQLALSLEIGNRRGEASVPSSLGAVSAALGRRAEARAQFERGLALVREIGKREWEAICLLNVADLDHEEGDVERAERNALECLALAEEIGTRPVVAEARCLLGLLRAGAGDSDAARTYLAAARDTAREVGAPDVETLACCRLASLPGGDAKDALAAFAALEPRLDAASRRSARLLLWKATGDRAHLVEAKRLLDDALAVVPAEHHATMLANVRVNREIAAAAKDVGL